MGRKFKLGVIGCGFMASSIIEGILKRGVLTGGDIFVANNIDAPFKKMSDLGIKTTFNNAEVASCCDFLLLSVKPQQLDEVAESLKGVEVNKIISILAGVTIERLNNLFPCAKVVRCMPNTPCSIGVGATAIDLTSLDNDDDRCFVSSIFGALGEFVLIKEDKMNAVTGISGSGPAYVYLFIKGLIDAGVKQGLTYEQAKILATNTVIGAGKMVLSNNDKSIDDLITAVCSKGGTTIEAVNSFNNDGLDKVIDRAVVACVKRADELGGKKLNTSEVLLYTDGACSGNPGVGGWACVLICGDKQKEISGGEKETTNNRMELNAVIEGLSAIKKPCSVTVCTDSAYVLNAFEKGWLYNWVLSGWKTADGGEVKNIDLWDRLLKLTKVHKVSFVKVKGHSNDEYNNLCDKLAVAECKKIKDE